MRVEYQPGTVELSVHVIPLVPALERPLKFSPNGVSNAVMESCAFAAPEMTRPRPARQAARRRKDDITETPEEPLQRAGAYQPVTRLS